MSNLRFSKRNKNRSFLRWSCKNVKNQKKWIFFLQKLPDTICVRKGEKKRASSCTLSVLAKDVFGPKQSKPGKTIKIVVSAEIAQNQKWNLFWEKVLFDMGEKVGFTNCVFEKLCFAESTIFIVLSEKHSFSETKYVCWTKHKIYEKKQWVVLSMAKWCFWGFFFWGFNVNVMSFWCVWHSSKSVKMLFFSQFGGLLWGGLFLFIWA